MAKAKEKSQNLPLRPPIVSVLGHVDHGKTTLLDYIRKTSFTKKEAGGITQSIGASVVQAKEEKAITFIDTPGHAAFTHMRSRGAKVADIAILVVAADDGVKPQTKEALNHIMVAKIPFIVAATKVDLSSASSNKVREQLEKQGVSFEGRGGEVPFVSVSGKTGKGVDELLEVISLVSELHEIKGDSEGSLDAVVIETGKDKRGPTVTVIIRNGSIKVGDRIVAETTKAKVRGLFDHKGKSTQKVDPGEPALILGFSDLPPVGSRVWGQEQEGEEMVVAKKRSIAKPGGSKEGINVVIKAGSAGSLEAIIDNLPEEVSVISSGVGEVNGSDVFLAKSGEAIILAFESKVPASVAKLAKTEEVKFQSFEIIYELFEKLEEMLEGGKEKISGAAEIVAIFPYNSKKVAGCKVIKGNISVKDNLILKRNDKELGRAKITSMKKEKSDTNEVKQGEECGIIIAPQLDFDKGDMLISVRK